MSASKDSEYYDIDSWNLSFLIRIGYWRQAKLYEWHPFSNNIENYHIYKGKVRGEKKVEETEEAEKEAKKEEKLKKIIRREEKGVEVEEEEVKEKEE